MTEAPAALRDAAFPGPVLDVLHALDRGGHRSWLVGGAVRDLLLRRARMAADFDVATPATPREVTALFPKVIPTGVAHGTVTVLSGGHAVEVTTFRGEGRYLDGRRPEAVTFHTELEADLARRDFTMNAMAYDPLGRVFRDPWHGREDMRRRRVRAVGVAAERFGEDGLRPMRAVRFAAQLGYTLEPRTRAAIRPALDVVRKVAAERLCAELEKLLLAPRVERGLGLLVATGLVEVVLPALAARGRDAAFHAVAVTRRVPPELPLRLAALLHALPPAEVETALSGLRFPRRVIEEAAARVRAHACSGGSLAPLPSGAPGARRWVAAVGPDRVEGQLALLDAELGARAPARRGRLRAEVKVLKNGLREVLAARPPLAVAELALDGRAVTAALGGAPGPHVGEALRHLLDRVLDDPALNTRDLLDAELRRWWAARSARL